MQTDHSLGRSRGRPPGFRGCDSSIYSFLALAPSFCLFSYEIQAAAAAKPRASPGPAAGAQDAQSSEDGASKLSWVAERSGDGRGGLLGIEALGKMETHQLQPSPGAHNDIQVKTSSTAFSSKNTCHLARATNLITVAPPLLQRALEELWKISFQQVDSLFWERSRRQTGSTRLNSPLA